MKRMYDTGTHSDIIGETMFIGTEVEHSPMFGKKTLFVVGVQDADKIKATANFNSCEHIYLGANMSFNVTENTEDQWQPWETMARQLLDYNFWVTLDIDHSQLEGLLESGLTENSRFIPMISVKLPYIQLLGYNACLKIDDRGFDETNPGVWVHSIHRLMDRDCYTSWDKYNKDTVI